MLVRAMYPCSMLWLILRAGWVDINLTVTAVTVPLLFTLLSDQALPVRTTTSTALLRIVSKGLKEPADKLQLIKVLSLNQVLKALEDKTRQEQIMRKSQNVEDEDEESYREALGKLLNVLGVELIKLLEVGEASHASYMTMLTAM
jgi:exportin-T